MEMTLDDRALNQAEAKSRERIAESIIQFAQDNDLKIHPGQDPFEWGELVIEKGGCPCLSKWRPQCPCSEALNDIKSNEGRCACGLFVNNAYLRTYYALLNKNKPCRRRRKNT